MQHVATAVDGWRAGTLDTYDVDELVHRYQRATRELWKFCWGAGGSHPEWVADQVRQTVPLARPAPRSWTFVPLSGGGRVQDLLLLRFRVGGFEDGQRIQVQSRAQVCAQLRGAARVLLTDLGDQRRR